MSPVPRYPRSDRGGYNSGYRGAPRGGGRGRGRGSHNSGGYESGPPVAPTYDSYETNGYNGGERYNSTPSTFGSYGGPHVSLLEKKGVQASLEWLCHTFQLFNLPLSQR